MDVEKIYILTGGIADIRKAIAKKLFYIFEVKDICKHRNLIFLNS